MTVMDAAYTQRFEASRNRLASLAYRLLGSAADAEDTVQDAFVRWQAADRERIEVPEAWLTRVVTNLALDRLKSASRRRERAVGDWLPEPVLDGDPMLGPAETAQQRESVSLAVLTLLEKLAPTERAVYVLREAFSHSHKEVAEILGISTAASQQHAHRARCRIAAERASAEIDRAAARRVVEAFVEAAASGRTERLVELLTDDVTALSDGAGVSDRIVRAQGRERIASMLRGAFKPTEAKRRLVGGSPDFHPGIVNGSPALVAAIGERVVGVVVLEVRDGLIADLHGVASVDRLDRLAQRWRRTASGRDRLGSW